MQKIAMENRQIIISKAQEEVGISVGSSHTIFSDVLDMKHVAAKFVPKSQNFDKNRRNL